LFSNCLFWKRSMCTIIQYIHECHYDKISQFPSWGSHWTTLNRVTLSVYNIYNNIDWLIVYNFTSRSRIFHLYGDVTIAGEGLQNLGLSSVLRAFEQGGIFIVPHLLWHRTSVFPVSSEWPPNLVAYYDTRGDVEDLF
jgi:hypothetical protein